MVDVRGGGVYSKTQVDSLLTSNDDEQLIWDSLASTPCWSTYVAYDVFKDSAKRASPEPYPNKLVLQNSEIISGSIPSTVYGFTSKTYTLGTAPEQIIGFMKYNNTIGGDVKFIVNFTGIPADDIILLDTSAAIDELNTDYVVPVGKQGTQLTFKVEIATDVSGNGGYMNFFAMIW